MEEKYFDRIEFCEQAESKLRGMKTDYNKYLVEYSTNENVLLLHKLSEEDTNYYSGRNAKLQQQMSRLEREISVLENVFEGEHAIYIEELKRTKVDKDTDFGTLARIAEAFEMPGNPWSYQRSNGPEELVKYITEQQATLV